MVRVLGSEAGTHPPVFTFHPSRISGKHASRLAEAPDGRRISERSPDSPQSEGGSFVLVQRVRQILGVAPVGSHIPILNKVGQFLVNLPLRNIIGQSKSTLDLREIMDGKKILIANLAKGKIGEDNTSVLGSLLLTEIWLNALGRAQISEEKRTPFYLYVDEFHSFITLSFADILSESRKYGLNLVMANQYLSQLDERYAVQSSAMSGPLFHSESVPKMLSTLRGSSPLSPKRISRTSRITIST